MPMRGGMCVDDSMEVLVPKSGGEIMKRGNIKLTPMRPTQLMDVVSQKANSISGWWCKSDDILDQPWREWMKSAKSFNLTHSPS